MNKRPALRSAGLHLLAFLLPALILLFVFWRMGFAPFGESSILIMDMNEQFIPFYASLRQAVSGGVFFSWSKGMGQNYIGLFAYYLASPLSWLLLAFPAEQLPEGVLLLTWLKISLCGLTFSVYLEGAFGERRAARLAFSACYALMSYNLVYSLCPMWLDAVLLLPLVLLGLERSLSGGRRGLLTGSVALLLFSNFYTAWPAALFGAAYCCCRWFSQDNLPGIRAFGRSLVRTAWAAVLGAALPAWLWLPALRALSGTAPATHSKELTYRSFWAVFQKLCPCVYDSITNSGLPSVYCGLGMAALAAAYFCNPKIPARARWLTGGVFVLLLGSFWLVPLDEFWHGMRQPTWFPYRYAYLFSFFLLRTAYCQFAAMGPFRLRGARRLLPAGLAALLCLELGSNSLAMLRGLDGQFGYCAVAEYRTFCQNTATLLEQLPGQGRLPFRVEKDYESTKNDALLLNYNGVTHYSSTFGRQLNAFTRSLGMAQTHYWNSYFGSTPVTDSIFSIRYVLARSPRGWPDTLLGQYSDAALWRNERWLPLGFAAASDGSALTLAQDPFLNQNALLGALSGRPEPVFCPVGYRMAREGDGRRVEIEFACEGPAWLFVSGDLPGAEVWIGGEYYAPYSTGETQCALWLGSFSGREAVQVSLCSGQTLQADQILIYRLDEAAFDAHYSALAPGGFTDTVLTGSGLDAVIDLAEPGVCFTSVPYSSGFSVRVDGLPAETFAWADTFLAFYAPAGRSAVRIRFVPPGFLAGAAVSLAALLRLVCSWLLRRRLAVAGDKNQKEQG